MLRVDVYNLLFTVINLLVLAVAMKIFLFRPVQRIIEERQKGVDAQFDEAAAAKTEADRMKLEYEQSVQNVEEEKKQIMSDTRKQAQAEYDKILVQAKTEARNIKDDAVAEATNQKNQILRNAEREIADMVVDAAAKVVGESKGAQGDGALYDKFLKKAGDEA
jgi:F-type H+-transporting ATPase subunit b